MAVQIMPDRNRPKYAGAQPTPEEAKAALSATLPILGRIRLTFRQAP